MHIREAEENDIPEILRVLKASLGETSSKKTEDIWRYKHVDNPFGKSLVLLAIDDGSIIGVRAFMKWQWKKKDRTFFCFRAVDTATHPNHQGKGVFKKLTMEAIQRAKLAKHHFIFNTPNQQSLPGYLKMKWEIVDKIKVHLYLSFPKKISGKINTDKINLVETEIKDLCDLYNRQNNLQGKFYTPKNVDYLSWRYHNNPMQSYDIFKEKGIYLAAYVKQHKNFKELRLSEAMVTEEQRKLAKIVIKNWCSKHGAYIVSSAIALNFLSRLNITGGFGPALTARDLNLSSQEYSEVLDLDSFIYTLGDLELF